MTFATINEQAPGSWIRKILNHGVSICACVVGLGILAVYFLSGRNFDFDDFDDQSRRSSLRKIIVQGLVWPLAIGAALVIALTVGLAAVHHPSVPVKSDPSLEVAR
jgi:hypothetical protein